MKWQASSFKVATAVVIVGTVRCQASSISATVAVVGGVGVHHQYGFFVYCRGNPFVFVK